MTCCHPEQRRAPASPRPCRRGIRPAATRHPRGAAPRSPSSHARYPSQPVLPSRSCAERPLLVREYPRRRGRAGPPVFPRPQAARVFRARRGVLPRTSWPRRRPPSGEAPRSPGTGGLPPRTGSPVRTVRPPLPPLPLLPLLLSPPASRRVLLREGAAARRRRQKVVVGTSSSSPLMCSHMA